MDDQQSTWTYTGADSSLLQPEVATPTQEVGAISWEASEYIAHEKPAGWYVALFGSTLAITAIVYFLNKDIITSIAIITASICAGIFASRKPVSRMYELSENGLKIDTKQYGFASFKSFSVVEDGAINSIWLKPMGRYQPNLVLYFSTEDEEKIVNVLSNYLPLEQRELDAIDRATRRLRF